MYYALYRQQDNNIYCVSPNLKVIKILQYWLLHQHIVFSTINIDNNLINERNFHTFKFDEFLMGNLQFDISTAVSMSFLKKAKLIQKTEQDISAPAGDLLKISIVKKFLTEFIKFFDYSKDKLVKDSEYFIKSLEISKNLTKIVIKDEDTIDKIFDDDIKNEKILIATIDNIFQIVIKKILDIDFRTASYENLVLNLDINNTSAFFSPRTSENLLYYKLYDEYRSQNKK